MPLSPPCHFRCHRSSSTPSSHAFFNYDARPKTLLTAFPHSQRRRCSIIVCSLLRNQPVTPFVFPASSGMEQDEAPTLLEMLWRSHLHFSVRSNMPRVSRVTSHTFADKPALRLQCLPSWSLLLRRELGAGASHFRLQSAARCHAPHSAVFVL
jgi:hypothetical protein